MRRAHVWSCGGGVQSTAIAVLMAQGHIDNPECIVMADTGREAQETWDYLNKYTRPMLAEKGMEIEIIPHTTAIYDLYGPQGKCLLPCYTFSGGESFGHPEKFGRLPGFCSANWKRDVCTKYLRSKGYGPSKPIYQTIGFSADEERRVKPDRVKWIRNSYPLIARNMTRADCISVVFDAGLPKPPRSSCWMCPHRKNSEWRHLRDTSPAEFAKACKLDEEIRSDGLYLHRDRKPLSQVNIELDGAACGETCDSGLCFV